MRHRFFALFFLFMCCCAGRDYSVKHASPARTHTEHWAVTVSDKFTEAQEKQIEDALDEWNYTLNGYGHYDLVKKNANDIEVELALFGTLATDQGLVFTTVSVLDESVQPGVLAWVEDLGAHHVFVVSDRIGSRDFKTIVMHEMGHTLGLEHVDVRGSLMGAFYPANETGGCIDEVTAINVAAVHHWHVENMNYCRLTL
jgi:hypothetical protein